MRILKIFSLICLIPYNSFACLDPSLWDYQVFATDGIISQRSDYQGMVGSYGDIKLTDFHVKGSIAHCLSVTSSQNMHLERGFFENTIETGESLIAVQIKLRGNALVRGTSFIRKSSLDGYYVSPRSPNILNSSYAGYKNRDFSPLLETSTDYAQELSKLSGEISTYEQNARLSVSQSQYMIKLDTKDEKSAVSISLDPLSGSSKFIISGRGDQLLYINLVDTDVDLSYVSVELFGGITAENILWNFPNAKSIELRYTQNPKPGFPGTILAPYASLDFYHGLVTGQVFVRRILPPPYDFPSGQVDPTFFRGFKLKPVVQPTPVEKKPCWWGKGCRR